MRQTPLILTPPKPADPLEARHQETFFRTAALHMGQYPELRFLAAVPNGGFRHKATAEAMRRQGVRRGVPDTFLPLPRGHYHGWYGELKRYGGTWSDVTTDQREWLAFLSEQGYHADWHKGWEAMWKSLLWYLNLPPAGVY